MNEQLKELLKQSGLQPYYDSQQGDIEKFAELIVQECAGLVEESKWNLPRGCTAADQAKYVKEHFGVK